MGQKTINTRDAIFFLSETRIENLKPFSRMQIFI